MFPARKQPCVPFALALVGALGVACGGDDAAGPSLDASLDAQLTGGSDTEAGVAPNPGDAAPLVADAASAMDAAADGSAATDAALGPEPGRLAGFTLEHNAARARAITSTPLAPLTWSPEIATVAQAYADKLAAGCLDTLAHSMPAERNNWGENLAAFTITGGKGNEANGTPMRTVVLWESETACYTYGPFQSGVNATCTEACRKYGGCGHLTQILWRKTTRVGCGVADCNEGRTRKSYWVCNYDPAGNVTGQLPY